MTLAQAAARALGLRVAAVDLFVDIGGDPDAMTIIEVNSNPSIRLLEQSDRGDLILKIWHHTFSAMGLLECLTCRNMATAFAWRGMAELLDALAIDRARLQRISVVVTGSNGKGSTAAIVRRDRPRLWPANRAVHLAASAIASTSGSGSTAPRSATTPWRG